VPPEVGPSSGAGPAAEDGPRPAGWVVTASSPGMDREIDAGGGGQERPDWAEPAPAPVSRPSGARQPSVMVMVGGPESQVPAPPMSPPSANGTPPRPVVAPLGRIDVELDKIEAKTFSVVRRGYDRDEVRAYLVAVARDYRQVIHSAKEAVNAARAAAAPAPAPVVGTSPAPPPPAPAPGRVFEDIGGRVTAVLTKAAEAAEEITSAAEKEALVIRQRARQEAEDLRRSAADALAEVEQTRAAGDQLAAELEADARTRAATIVVAAEQRAAQLEDEAKLRASTMERTVRANIDAVIAEARRDYEHLRSAQQQCIDRLASVEFLARHARDGMSESAGQSIDELL
jgi:DivIVA domain-containing protein